MKTRVVLFGELITLVVLSYLIFFLIKKEFYRSHFFSFGLLANRFGIICEGWESSWMEVDGIPRLLLSS